MSKNCACGKSVSVSGLGNVIGAGVEAGQKSTDRVLALVIAGTLAQVTADNIDCGKCLRCAVEALVVREDGSGPGKAIKDAMLAAVRS